MPLKDKKFSTDAKGQSNLVLFVVHYLSCETKVLDLWFPTSFYPFEFSLSKRSSSRLELIYRLFKGEQSKNFFGKVGRKLAVGFFQGVAQYLTAL